MGEVRQDRGVVGDARGRDRPRARARWSRRPRPRYPRATIARSARWSSGAPGRRRVLRVRLAARADLRLDRAEHAARQARGLERGHGEERRRGLAVRAGDPDDAKLVARVAVPPGGRVGEGGRAAVDHDLGQADVGEWLFNDRRDGSRVGRPLDEVVAIDVRAANGDEEAARPDAATVVAHAADLQPGEGRRADGLATLPRPVQQAGARQPVDELAELPGPCRLRGGEEAADRRGAHSVFTMRRRPGPGRGRPATPACPPGSDSAESPSRAPR